VKGDQRRAMLGRITFAAISLVVPCALYGQHPTVIKTDGTLGHAPATLAPSATNTVVPGNVTPEWYVPGGVYKITQSQGLVKGHNLFHSFEAFSVGAGDAAMFTTNTASVKNVISRVTGSLPTTIEGLVTLIPEHGGTPNFFFINPNGVTLAAGGLIDVPGGLHVSTAQYLKFNDGKFYADARSGSTLSTAEPEAFGFLGTQRTPVKMSDDSALAALGLTPLSVVAGDIEIDNSLLFTDGGSVRIAAVGNTQVEVPLAANELPLLSGNLKLRNTALVRSQVSGSASARDMLVSAGNITIDGTVDETGISSQTLGPGDAASIRVSATRDIVILGSGFIASSSHSTGNARLVKVDAENILLDGGGRAANINSLARDRGDAGGVMVFARDKLTLRHGGIITSNTFAQGNAGNVQVQARNIDLDGIGSDFQTGITSDSEITGNAGRVDVTAVDDLRIVNAALISSTTFGRGDADRVVVSARNLLIDGALRKELITGIATDTEGTGRGGSIDVKLSGHLALLKGGQISTDVFSRGDGGSVRVKADSITIDGQGTPAFISSDTDSGSSGVAGSLEVSATRDFEIFNRGLITSTVSGTGKSSAITVRANTLTLSGEGEFAGIFSESNGSAHAGTIDIGASAVNVVDGGRITSNAKASGAAGSVVVHAGTLLVDGGSSTITAGAASGSSGHTGKHDHRGRPRDQALERRQPVDDKRRHGGKPRPCLAHTAFPCRFRYRVDQWRANHGGIDR
jgi:filamentous hemagglutinin family protein